MSILLSANCEVTFVFSMKRDLDSFVCNNLPRSSSFRLLTLHFFQMSHANHSLPETFMIDDTFLHFSSLFVFYCFSFEF